MILQKVLGGVALIKDCIALESDQNLADLQIKDGEVLLAISGEAPTGKFKLSAAVPMRWARFDIPNWRSGSWGMSASNYDAVRFVAKIDCYFFGFGMWRERESSSYNGKYKIKWGLNDELGTQYEWTMKSGQYDHE